MKKEINQNNGTNQVALFKSNNNQITIINNPVDYMTSLIKDGRIEEAAKVFADVHKKTESLHPLYPLYRYKPIEIGSKIAFKHSPANEKIAEAYPLRFKGKFSISDSDFNEDETLGDFLTRKYFSQEKIKIDIKYIETWIGEQLIQDSISLEQQVINDGEWFILPKKLQPPIKAKLVLTEEIDRVIIDYLELRITSINNKEKSVVISNVHQNNSPIILTLTIPGIFDENPETGNPSKFNIKIRENFEGKVIAEKTFLEFMKYVGRSSKMTLIDIERHKLFFTAENINLDQPEDFQETDDRISLLSDLQQIENALDIEFQLPEIIYEEDLEKIEILKSIIEDKEIIAKIENFSAVFESKEALEKLIYDIKDKPIMITSHEEKVIMLFGVRIENIHVDHRFENLIVKSPDRIKKKLEFLDDGETAKVEFIPGTKNTVITRYSIVD